MNENERQGQDPQGPEKQSRRDPFADLEARIDAAMEEVRPKLKKAFEELDARVDSAMKELRPRMDEAMDDVRPRVDRFIADAQPRLDGVLEKIQAKIAELRKDLENRAGRREVDASVTALPRTGESSPPEDSGPGTPGL